MTSQEAQIVIIISQNYWCCEACQVRFTGQTSIDHHVFKAHKNILVSDEIFKSKCQCSAISSSFNKQQKIGDFVISSVAQPSGDISDDPSAVFYTSIDQSISEVDIDETPPCLVDSTLVNPESFAFPDVVANSVRLNGLYDTAEEENEYYHLETCNSTTQRTETVVESVSSDIELADFNVSSTPYSTVAVTYHDIESNSCSSSYNDHSDYYYNSDDCETKRQSASRNPSKSDDKCTETFADAETEFLLNALAKCISFEKNTRIIPNILQLLSPSTQSNRKVTSLNSSDSSNFKHEPQDVAKSNFSEKSYVGIEDIDSCVTFDSLTASCLHSIDKSRQELLVPFISNSYEKEKEDIFDMLMNLFTDYLTSWCNKPTFDLVGSSSSISESKNVPNDGNSFDLQASMLMNIVSPDCDSYLSTNMSKCVNVADISASSSQCVLVGQDNCDNKKVIVSEADGFPLIKGSGGGGGVQHDSFFSNIHPGTNLDSIDVKDVRCPLSDRSNEKSVTDQRDIVNVNYDQTNVPYTYEIYHNKKDHFATQTLATKMVKNKADTNLQSKVKNTNNIIEVSSCNSNVLFKTDHKDLAANDSVTYYKVGNSSLLNLASENEENEAEGMDSQSDKEKTCSVCNIRFSTHKALNRHLIVNGASSRAYKCKVCLRKFHNLAQLNLHVYEYHEKGSKPTCFKCSSELTDVRCLDHHIQRHRFRPTKSKNQKRKTKRRLVKCVICGVFSFNQPSAIAAHQRKHAKTLPYQCNQCPKRFLKRIALNIHVTAVHRGYIFTCDLCDQSFKDNASRCLHRLSHQVNTVLIPNKKAVPKRVKKNQSFNCTECGKTYKDKRNLQRHIDVEHKGIKDYEYKCEYCYQQFFKSVELRDHIAWKHFGEKPYVCQVCGQGFVSKPTLVRHQKKVHIDVKPHNCKYCGEGFLEKHKLELHEVESHTHVYPMHCPHCNKGFVQAGKLRSHVKLHTERHVCGVCGEGFTKSNHLTRHNKSCAKKLVRASSSGCHVCKLCGKGFQKGYILSRHIKSCAKKQVLSASPYTTASYVYDTESLLQVSHSDILSSHLSQTTSTTNNSDTSVIPTTSAGFLCDDLLKTSFTSQPQHKVSTKNNIGPAAASPKASVYQFGNMSDVTLSLEPPKELYNTSSVQQFNLTSQQIPRVYGTNSLGPSTTATSVSDIGSLPEATLTFQIPQVITTYL